jgi:hypothetical protein
MANQTWTASTSGSVLDTVGTAVGTANGSGVITITAHVVVSGGFTLTIEAGVTVEVDGSFAIRVGDGADTADLVCNGTSADPIVLTSAATSPAVGDWLGIEMQSAVAANVGHANLTFTTIEYSDSAIGSVTGLTDGQKVTCTDCTFRRIEGTIIQAGLVNTQTWTFTRCVFEKCEADQTTTASLITAARTMVMTLDHCSIYAEYNHASDISIFTVQNTALLTITSTIFEGANSLGGDCFAASVAVGATLTPAFNWYIVDSVNDYVPAGSDSVQDANFFNDTCPGPLDLRPDANTGVRTADAGGALLGALAAWNVVPTGGWSGGEPEDRESHGPKLPSDKTGRILFGAPQRKLGDVSDVVVRGTVIGLNGTTAVYKEDITSRREVARTSAGSFQLPSGSNEEVNLANMTSARVLLVESSVSCTLTFSGDQRVNLGGPKGFALLHIWRNRNVNNFTVKQSNGSTATINWFGGQ